MLFYIGIKIYKIEYKHHWFLGLDVVNHWPTCGSDTSKIIIFWTHCLLLCTFNFRGGNQLILHHAMLIWSIIFYNSMWNINILHEIMFWTNSSIHISYYKNCIKHLWYILSLTNNSYNKLSLFPKVFLEVNM